jgi:hypothetical protein
MLKGRMLSDTHRTISALDRALEDYGIGSLAQTWFVLYRADDEKR